MGLEVRPEDKNYLTMKLMRLGKDLLLGVVKAKAIGLKINGLNDDHTKLMAEIQSLLVAKQRIIALSIRLTSRSFHEIVKRQMQTVPEQCFRL